MVKTLNVIPQVSLNVQYVIPAYETSPYIEECLKSVLAQDIQSSVCVATSTPNAYLERICEKYNVPLHINTNPGLGIASDWNFAYNLSNASLTIIAHQDDIYLPEFSKNIIKFFHQNKTVGIAFTDCYELIGSDLRAWNKREFIKKIIREFAFLGANRINATRTLRLLLSFGCPIPCPAVIFNANEISNFSFSSEFKVNLDWDAWYRLAKNNIEFGYIRKRLMIHRIHSEAETQVAIKDNRRVNEDIKMFSRFWPSWMVKCLSFLYRAGY